MYRIVAQCVGAKLVKEPPDSRGDFPSNYCLRLCLLTVMHHTCFHPLYETSMGRFVAIDIGVVSTDMFLSKLCASFEVGEVSFSPSFDGNCAIFG